MEKRRQRNATRTSCTNPSAVSFVPAWPLRHLYGRILFLFLKKIKRSRCSSEENINQAAAGEFVQDMKWVTHGYQVPGRRLAHREGNKIRCKEMMPTQTLDLKHSIIINFKMNYVQFIVLLRSPFPFKTLQLQNEPSQTHTNYYVFWLFVLFVWSSKWTCANDDDPWFWSTTGIW